MTAFYIEPEPDLSTNLRENFPKAGEEYLGEPSDGIVYRTTFAGSSLSHTFEMIRQFLREEGFENIPLPRDADELRCFRLNTRNKQILLFEDNGYAHNPVKILFPRDGRNKKQLILEIYNERADRHLLRFHGKI